MSKWLLIVLSIAVLMAPASARIITVDNNPGNTNAFRTAQIGNDSANAGDTIYVIGSSSSYGTLRATKRLSWFGPGFFLNENSETQASSSNAIIGLMTIDTGSANSLFCGLRLSSLITIQTDSITIRRCYIAMDYNPCMILLSVNNVLVEQCYINHTWWQTINIIQLNSSHNVIFRNNYIGNSSTNGSTLFLSSSTAGPFQFTNNIFNMSGINYGTVNVWNGTFTNNISDCGFVANNNSWSYNIGTNTQFGTANGNRSNVSWNTIFTLTGSTDARWQLATNSPARYAGYDSTDCGIYGGANPYVLSGLPNIPTITFFSSAGSGSTTTGLAVTIRARGRN